MDKIRQRLKRAIDESGRSLSDLSKKCGRNHAYLQQFINRGTPQKLPEDVRRKLSVILSIPENELGGPNEARYAGKQPGGTTGKSAATSVIDVKEYDVAPSAGGGAMVYEEEEKAVWSLPASYVAGIARSPKQTAILEVVGDSMSPTLATGDKIMVDLTDKNPRNPGIFVLFDGDATVVKRIEIIPGSSPAMLVLISDNPLHRDYDVPAESVHIAGRVVWFARRI